MKSVYSKLLGSEPEPCHPSQGRLSDFETDWSENASCFNQPDFLLSDGEACQDCPVKVICLEFAIKNNLMGIWGGTNDRQRREIKRNRAMAAAMLKVAGS